MKTTRAAKGERRAHRKAKERRRRDERISIQDIGVDPALLDRIAAAAGSGDGGSWEAVAPMILPILKRVHHPYPPGMEPLHIRIPPGIPTGFGIDFGPAFSHVSAAMVESWGIGHATLLATALGNLRRIVDSEPPQVQDFTVDGESLLAIQGQGWGSALLLLPDILRPILGDRARVLLAPVRNTVVALPEDVELGLAAAVWQSLADGAHDELEVDPMRWTGTTVVAIGDPSRGLPN